MKLLIFNYSLTDTSDLAIDLIPMGLECQETTSKDEAIKVLKKNNAMPIFLTENYEIDFLKQVKEINPSICIFLLVKNSIKPDAIKSLSTLGISAIINFSQNTNQMAEEIVRCIVTSNIHPQDKRTHIRIKPKDFEEIKGAIYLKSLNKFIKGNIIDISAGGTAILLDDSTEVSLLSPKTVYDPLIILIKGDSIKTLATLIAVRKNAAGFRFDNVEAVGMRKIAAYIHYRISENSRDLQKNTSEQLKQQ